MTLPTVAATIYCMPSTGCVGESLVLPMYAPQWGRMAREVQCVLPAAGGVIRFACYSLSVNRAGLAFEMLCADGIYRTSRFVLDGWELAWDQLGIATTAEFSAFDAIETYSRIRDKIRSGTVVRKRGQHGRKTNTSKGGAAAGDLEERCYFESIVHCRSDGESLYGAAKRALESTPRGLLPRSLRARIDAVWRDAGKSYAGRHEIRDVIKDVLRNIRLIERRNNDARRA